MRNSGAAALAIVLALFVSAPGNSEEGSDLTGGDGPHLAYLRADDGQFHRIPYINFAGLAIAQGDIILGTHAEVQQQSAYNLASEVAALDYKTLKKKPPDLEPLREKLSDEVMSPFAWVHPLDSPKNTFWPGGNVPYVVDPSINDPDLRTRIAEAAADWNKLGIVQIKPIAEFPAYEVSGTHPLTIYSSALLHDAQGHPSDPDVFRCKTHIGYDSRPPSGQRARNTMFLSNVCTKGSIVHEMGHALGLLHEHVRQDRDAFMKVDTTLVIDMFRFNYEKQAGQSLQLSYDPCSIMHYGNGVSANWTTTGQKERWFVLTEAGKDALAVCRKAMDPTCGQVNPGQRCLLSPVDIETVRRLYK